MRLFGITAIATCVLAAPAFGAIYTFTDASGLSAEAEFTFLDATTLQIRLKNTSTGAPFGFDSADQLLTGISWDFGMMGDNPGDTMIIGGTAIIGATSHSVNFDTGAYGPGTDIGGEWGYSNGNGTGMLQNFISSNTAHATVFGGPNLDGPVSIDGPQAGILADPEVVPIGGLGAIQNEIVATLYLSQDSGYSDLGDVIRVEFGSDAYFIDVPAPGALALFGLAAAIGRRRRRA